MQSIVQSFVEPSMCEQTGVAMASQQQGMEALQAFQAAQIKMETPELQSILQQMMTDGVVRYEWRLLRPFIHWKLQQVVLKLQGDNPRDVAEAMNTIEGPLCLFTNAPFTIQRICELLCEPDRYYKDPLKFLRGFEKLVRVNSMVPVSTTPDVSTSGMSQVPEQGNRTPAAVWVPTTVTNSITPNVDTLLSNNTLTPLADTTAVDNSTFTADAQCEMAVVDEGGPKEMEE